MTERELSYEEKQGLEAIEIYRQEHTTWNLERLRSIFAENPTVVMQDAEYRGREAVDELLRQWCGRAGIQMRRRHGRLVVRGNLAAVEWQTTGIDEKGKPIDRAGVNIFEFDRGRIKYVAIYRAR